MKYLFFILFSTFLFAESFFTFQNINGLTAEENGIELIEPESYATNCILKLPFAHDTNYYNMSKSPDFSTSHNDATVQGATFQNHTNGYSFDGINDYINFGNISDFDFHNDNFTLLAWIKTDRSGFIMQKGTSSGHFYGWYFYADSAGKLHLLTVGPVKRVISTSIVTNDVWTLATVTMSNGTGRIFCNTTCEATTSGMNPTDVNVSMQIGKNTTESSFFNGYIDDPRIYNRALTSSEILNIYNATSPAHPN